MYRRAYEGVDKPVYQQKEMVGTVREFSDGLAQFLAKAYRAKFREHIRLDVSTVDNAIEQELARVAGRSQAQNAGPAEGNAGAGSQPPEPGAAD